MIKKCSVLFSSLFFAVLIMGIGFLFQNGFIADDIFPEASAAEIADSGSFGENVTYILDSEGTLTFSGAGEMDARPYEYFYGCDDDVYNFFDTPWEKTDISVKKVIISDGITSIGYGAFYDCDKLRSVSVGKDVKKIESFAFSECVNLKKINIPDGVTYIGTEAFYSCRKLKSINIPASVKSIYEGAFRYCTALESITMGKGIEFISNEAFSYCYGLQSVVINSGELTIAEEAFYCCTALQSVTINADNLNIEEYAFSYNDSLKSITLGKGDIKIGNYAFSSCKELKNITLPDGVFYIGECAFSMCISLKSISIPGSVSYIGNRAFSECENLHNITIADGVTGMDSEAFSGCGYVKNKNNRENGILYIGNYLINASDTITECKIRKNTKTICMYAFKDCTLLESVSLPDGITHIEKGAFYGCSRLSDISVPDNITSIAKDAFSCTKYYSDDKNWDNGVLYVGNYLLDASYTITECNVREYTRVIGEGAFYNCAGLESVTLPDSVVSIGDSAFRDCSKLRSINIPDGVTSIGESVFDFCSSLQNIELHDKITSIGNTAFLGCDSLKSVTIPDSVTSIGDSAFSSCDGLKSITIGKGITYIGNGAFNSCEGIKTITIPDGVTNIGENVFSYCENLHTVYLGKGIKSMDASAFDYCFKLQNITVDKKNLSYSSAEGILFSKDKTEIIRYPEGIGSSSYTIPDGVTKIGNSAFRHCENLKEVVIPSSVADIGIEAFSYCCELKTLTICNKKINIGRSAFYDCDYIKDIYFSGNKNQWDAVLCSCEGDNGALADADIHFNYHVHSYKTSGKAATCIKEGYTKYTCACGDTYKETNGKAAHKYSKDFTVDKKATYTTDGSKSRHCTTEGCTARADVTVIPKLVVAFTDSESAKINGKNVFVCSGLTAAKLLLQTDKGAEIKTADGKAVAEKALIGTGMYLLMADGSKKELVVPGDTDGDGNVTVSDARLALRASVGLEKYKSGTAVFIACDADNDNKTTASDARLILRASVGLEKLI